MQWLPHHILFNPSKLQKIFFFLHQFPINILGCGTVKTSVIPCLLCSQRCGAEGSAPNKLWSRRRRVSLISELYCATSLACLHTGICSIMNPNVTTKNRKITACNGQCGITWDDWSSLTTWHYAPFIHLSSKRQINLFKWKR